MGVALAVLSGFGSVLARTIKIIEAQNLELRNVVVKDETGREQTQEFIVISGPRVELSIDKSTMVAQRIEFNKTQRTLTLVGRGIYTSVSTDKDNKEISQKLEGDDLVVNIGAEDVQGEDVLISTGTLDVSGEKLRRIPGQIEVDKGYFTSCAKCGRNPNDYAFRADRLVIYPGDRLIAYGVQILLADDPIFYLPVLISFLGNDQLQPKFSFGNADPDGLTLGADLPFVAGEQTYGISYLRFYEHRDPAVGFGVKLKSYDVLKELTGAPNVFNLESRLDPKPLSADGKYVDGVGGYLYDYNLDWKGRYVALNDKGVQFAAKVQRADTRQDATLKNITTADIDLSTSTPDFDFSAKYFNQYIHDPKTAAPSRVLKRPEVMVDPKAWKASLGGISLGLDTKFTVGRYFAPTNLGNREALAAATADPISQLKFSEESRFLLDYNLNFGVKLWSGASFDLTNIYQGKFYTNENRAVDTRLSAGLTQVIGSNSFKVQYDFARIEGQSPFQFDAPPLRSTQSKNMSFSATLQPISGIVLTASQAIDLTQPTNDKQKPAQFGVDVTLGNLIPELPLNITYRQGRQIYKATGRVWGEIDSWSLSSSLNKGGWTFSAGTAWRVAQTAGDSDQFDPLLLRTSLVDPDGQGSLNFSLNKDLNKGVWTSTSLDFRGNASKKLGISGADGLEIGVRETYSFVNPRIEGLESLAYGKTKFEVSHDFLLPDDKVETEDPSEGQGALKATLQGSWNDGGRSSSSWSLSYGSVYGGINFNLKKADWDKPVFSAAYSSTGVRQKWDANLDLLLPGLKQTDSMLQRLSLSGAQEIVQDRLAVQIKASYNRNLRTDNRYDETIKLDPLRIVTALGPANAPTAYLETGLGYTWSLTAPPTQSAAPFQPTIGLLINRCCWAMRGELNLSNNSVKFSWLIPGGTNAQTSLLEVDSKGTRTIFDGLSEANR
ncbi:MAG: hypothetical protein U0Z75_00135 [Deinococcaceae bacterium]